jgi:hypothetical protein
VRLPFASLAAVLAIVAGLATSFVIANGEKSEPRPKVAIQEFRAEKPHHWIDDYQEVDTSRPMCATPPGPVVVTRLPNGAMSATQVLGVSRPCPHYNVK